MVSKSLGDQAMAIASIHNTTHPTVISWAKANHINAEYSPTSLVLFLLSR